MDFLVLRRSYLNVKGRQLKKYKKCWVKLQDNVLGYYGETDSPSDLIESITLVDGIRADRAEKKESKEEFSIKVHQPANKNYVPLYIAADTELEILEWLKDFAKAVDIVTLNVFGVDLSVTVRKNKQAIPIVVEKCLAYLRGFIDVAGIFRVSGAQSEVLSYKAAFDRGEDVDFSSCKDPHVVSNVLKLYLRELPNPLLTAESYQRFIDANSLPADRVYDEIKSLVNNLPTAHRVTLHHLIQFLTVVGAQSAENKMTPANLAIVFGPTILRPGKEEKFEDAGNMEIANRLTERLIHNYDQIFDQTLPTIKRVKHQQTHSGTLPSVPLPEGWVEHFTPEGKPYYYNAAGGVTTWERPLPTSAPTPAPTSVPVPAVVTPSEPPKSLPVNKLTHSPQTTHEAPRPSPGSPLTSRAKSIMISPEMASQLGKIHAPEGEPSPPLAMRPKRPGSGNPTPAPPQSNPTGPDSDELKQRLAKRAAQPKPPASPAVARANLNPVAPPAASSASPSSTLSPTSTSVPDSVLMPPPANLPPPVLSTPPFSPTLSSSANLPPPVTHTEEKPALNPKNPPIKAESTSSITPPFGRNSTGKLRPAAPPRSPQIGPSSALPTSLPPPVSSSDDPEDLASKVVFLENRIATLEQQQAETNALLKNVLAALEAHNLYQA